MSGIWERFIEIIFSFDRTEFILGFQMLAKASPILAKLLLLGCYVIKPLFVFIPFNALYIVAGIIFNPGIDLLITYVGIAIEVSLSFAIGRKFGARRFRPWLARKKNGDFILNFSDHFNLGRCFVIRMIRGVPSDLISMYLGTTKVKYWHFLVGTLLGFTPAAVPMVLLGNAAADPTSPAYMIPFGIGLFISALVIFYTWRKNKKATP
jgi:uncharacterized membrane protein YdjX (TVP38/TMEM64 family)